MLTNTKNDIEMIRKARNAYMREYFKRNPDKRKKNQEKWILKNFTKIMAGGVNDEILGSQC